MRGVEDQLGRAVVALELDDGRVGIVALEVEDVADIGASPAVAKAAAGLVLRPPRRRPLATVR